MKERGIIFSAPMVRALLAGQKTQTRRIVKPQPSPATAHPQCSPMARYLGDACHSIMWYTPKPDGGTYIDRDENSPWRCPYGAPGDRLWVREAHQFCDKQMDDIERDDPVCVIFRADMKPYRFEPTPRFVPNQHADEWRIGPWRPSIYLPRWASRITLEVVGVRIERLHEISDGDARAEGVDPAPFTRAGRPADHVHVEAYEALWERLHGAGSWAENSWVWVIEFRRLQP